MTSRILGLLLFAVLCGTASLQSHAQSQPGTVTQLDQARPSSRYQHNRYFFRHQFFNRRKSPVHSGVSLRQSDPYEFYDVSQRYPKYYGAFHYRHFSDLGVPAGDIGLRGNGIYWTPW